MPKGTKSEGEHAHITIRISGYEVTVQAGVNHSVYAPEYAWNLDEHDPLYEFTTRVVLTGTATVPRGRAGHRYELTLVDDVAASPHLQLLLESVQVRDGEYNAPLYRSYRGRQIPVFDPPAGIGTIGKVRGQERWTAYLFVSTCFVRNALALLGHDRELYLFLHERKHRRRRWIQSLSLQTSDPAGE